MKIVDVTTQEGFEFLRKCLSEQRGEELTKEEMAEFLLSTSEVEVEEKKEKEN